MDIHRLAEERSLAYHRVIAVRIRREPAILSGARHRVSEWITTTPGPPPFVLAWNEVLEGDPDTIAQLLVDPGEHARELRQSTPFAGALAPQERWRIWGEVRDRLGAEQGGGPAPEPGQATDTISLPFLDSTPKAVRGFLAGPDTT